MAEARSTELILSTYIGSGISNGLRWLDIIFIFTLIPSYFCFFYLFTRITFFWGKYITPTQILAIWPHLKREEICHFGLPSIQDKFIMNHIQLYIPSIFYSFSPSYLILDLSNQWQPGPRLKLSYTRTLSIKHHRSRAQEVLWLIWTTADGVVMYNQRPLRNRSMESLQKELTKCLDPCSIRECWMGSSQRIQLFWK